MKAPSLSAPKQARLPGGIEAPALGRARHHYRMEDGLRVIDIRVPDITHLFNELDPSPPETKDLDPELDDYICEAVDEIGGPERAMLVFHLPPEQLAANDARALTETVHNFFAYRSWVATRKLRDTLRRGYRSLVIALAFLFTCLILRRLIEGSEPTPGQEIVAEGLLIIGWVAMWRPLELLLYDWWPILRERRLDDRLTEIRIDWRAQEKRTA